MRTSGHVARETEPPTRTLPAARYVSGGREAINAAASIWADARHFPSPAKRRGGLGWGAVEDAQCRVRQGPA